MDKKSVMVHNGGGITSFRYSGLLQAGSNLISLWESPLWAGLLAGLIYAMVSTAHGPLLGVSEHPYFNYLADAFLHGQLSLRLMPPSYHDLVMFNNQVYLYWPPLPAVLMMPFVALLGVNFSDVAFTVGISAGVIALLAVLLRAANQRRVIDLSPTQRGALVLFAAFGTVIFVLAPRGRVWFTSQMVSLLFVTMAYLTTLRLRGWKAFFFTGCALAAALATRNTLLFAGIWPAYYLIKEHWQPAELKRMARLALAGLAPIIAVLLLLALYDWARFGNPLDFGYAYHQMSIKFQQDYQQYGPFSLHYLSANLFYNYVYYPFPIDPAQLFDGGSLFLLSPLFFAAAWAFMDARRRISGAFLLLTILVLNVPILLLMGTGWVTFGPRYTLDFIVPLLLLTALGLPRWPGWASGLAIFVSMAHYLFGALIKLP